MLNVKTVLNPQSFSEASSEAYQAACDMARHHQAKLVLLHVTERLIVSYFEDASELPPDEVQKKLFETLRPPQPEEAELNVEHRVVEGDAVRQILAAANESHCDLIVMGPDGSSAMSRLFKGSIMADVIRHAPCSVMIAKPTAQPSATDIGVEQGVFST